MTQSNGFLGLVAAVLIAVFVLSDSLFIVRETEKGMVFLFGEMRRQYNEPGLKFKIPFLEKVVLYDVRLQGYQLVPLEVGGKEQDKINISLYVRFKVENPLVFYKTATTVPVFIDRLTGITVSTMREVIGKNAYTALLSDERGRLMNEIQGKVSRRAVSFGANVVDVRIVEAELPVANRDAVFNRMRSDRQRIAKKIRAEGEERARKIRSEADKDREVILADASRQSDILRGEGIAKAMSIYTDVVKTDPEFFEFNRSLEAYVSSFQEGNTTFMLAPDSKFFKHFGTQK